MSTTSDSTTDSPQSPMPIVGPREYEPVSILYPKLLPRIPGNSDQNLPVENVRSFCVLVTPARVLKQAIRVLCGPDSSEVQGPGLGDIHVDEKGLEISFDTHKGSNSFLSLLYYGLVNSEYHRPNTETHIVNLRALYSGLAPVLDDDTVTVYHVDGSNKLFFKFDAETSVPPTALPQNILSIATSLSHEHEQNPDESIRSFSFQLKPARTLKQAMRVLCDFGVNELGLAYFHADEKGFQITVDTKEGSTCLLSLSAPGLMNFQCREPSTDAQIVLLTMIGWSLATVDDEDTITVYKVDGSNNLVFTFERPGAVRGFSFDYCCCRNYIGEHPEIETYTEGTLPSHDLSRVFREISMADEERRQVVAVEIEDCILGNLKFDHMDELEWNIDYAKFKHLGTEGTELEQNYRAWLHCNFTTALDKACNLVDEHDDVRVRFSLLPTKVVVFQFDLGEVGSLLILRRALEMEPEYVDILSV